MLVHVINLDRLPGRWSGFHRVNGFLPEVRRFPAVDGGSVDRAALVAEGLLVEPCSRTDGALGCALSHVALWRHAVRTGEAMTVVEDDTVLAPDFVATSREVLDGVPDWELVLWGWNFDMPLWLEAPEEVGPCLLTFDQELMRRNIGAFSAEAGPRAAMRVRHFFGAHAYSITPAGAETLLRTCLPMSDRLVRFRDGAVFDNRHLESDMNAGLAGMRAYACLPPLALAENRHETSTTVRSL